MNKPNDYVTDMFHKLREDISWIKNKLFASSGAPPKSNPVADRHEYTIDATHKHGNASEKKDDSIHATLNFPETINIKAETTESHKPWYRDRKVWFEAVGISIGCVVALIYFLQWNTMDKTLKITRDQFDLGRRSSERESRALVSIKGNGEIQVEREKPVQVQIRLTNLGKTTARHVSSIVYVEVIPRLQAPTLFHETPTPSVRYIVPDLLPGDTHDFPADRQRAKGPILLGGPTESWPLEDDEFKKLMAGETYVVVSGSVEYEDVYQVKHWSNFCLRRYFGSIGTNALSCTQYNTEDQNDEP